jgi:shikimate kinase
MMRSRIIYVIGFMGSGKSTAGKRLAVSLGWEFLDLDRVIEDKTGKKIPQIFSQDGEAAFRKAESEALKGIDNKKGIVVATGGGTPCHDDNMDYMLEHGLTVYLKMTPDQLTHRLLESSTARPLIQNVSDEDLPSFIAKALMTRESFYNRAEIIVPGNNLDLNRLLKMLKEKM